MTRPLRILLVDDHHDGADSLSELLRLLGYTAQAVYGSSAALATVADEQPDVVIADIGMPHLNGYELAARVRALYRQTPLLIALTGYAHAEVREECLKAGFDHFFVKPAEPAEILTVLRQHSERLAQEIPNQSV